jgi:hypothetical protein
MVDIPAISSPRRRMRRGEKITRSVVFLQSIIVLCITSDIRQLVHEDAAGKFVLSTYARDEQPSAHSISESKASFAGSWLANGSIEHMTSNEPTSSSKLTSSTSLFLTERTSKVVGRKGGGFFRDGAGMIGRKFFPRSRRQGWTVATQVLGGADSGNGNVPMPVPSEDPPNDAVTEESALPVGRRESVMQQASQSWMIVQQIFSRVGPSLLAILSLVGYNADMDGVSFLNLYAMSLLGASCGFHIFLYFITLGYALGVTMPIATALFLYQVSSI